MVCARVNTRDQEEKDMVCARVTLHTAFPSVIIVTRVLSASSPSIGNR
jgi:hypothetical protein